MSGNGHMDARKLHARFNHPTVLIDADGHWVEYGPVMQQEFRRIGGGDARVEAFEKQAAEVLVEPGVKA